MTIQVNKGSMEGRLKTLTAQYNLLLRHVAGGAGTGLPHAGITSTQGSDIMNPSSSSRLVTSPNATNEATLVTLANDIKAIYSTYHIADTGAHKAADAANAIAAADATNTATAITLLNEVKADYNTHRASTTYHYAADATNAVSSADATDEASAITLANEIKTDLNAHIIFAVAAQTIEEVGP